MAEDKSFNADYCAFVAEGDECVSSSSDDVVLSYVRSDLRRHHRQIFVKFLLVQLVMGLLTLLFCPQFDVSLTSNVELMHYFHYRYGAGICALFCGAIFTAPGAICAAYMFTHVEVQTIKTAGSRYHLAIAALALLVFYVCGADVFSYTTLLWFVAAGMVAMVLFGFSLRVRVGMGRI